MRLLCWFILLFSYVHAYPKCENSLVPRNEWAQSSPYYVDKVDCNKGKLFWIISNTPFLKHSPGFKSYPYFVEKLQIKENKKRVWTISNQIYMKKSRPVARHIASIEKSTEKKLRQSFKFAPYSGVASLSASDKISNATEKAFSSLGKGFHISWKHFWMEKWSFGLHTAYYQYDFRVGDKRKLVGKSSFEQQSIGLNLNYKFNKFGLRGELVQGDTLLLSSSGSQQLSIESISVQNINLELSYILYQFDNGFDLKLNSVLGRLTDSNQSDIKISNGSLYGVGIGSYLKQATKSYFIKGSYTQRELELTDSIQKSRQLGIYAGVGFNF